MLRLLFIGLIGYIVYGLIRGVFRALPKNKAAAAKKSIEAGEMVGCAKCQTFVLRSEAIEKGGKLYCSKNCIKTVLRT